MDIFGKLRPFTNSGCQTILALFLWPGNEASIVYRTHPTHFLLFPSSETNFH